MRIVRYQHGGSEPRTGWVLDDRVGPIDGDPFGEFQRLDAFLQLSEVKLCIPVLPSKIVCVGRNYAAHAEEHGAEVPELPIIFLKPPSTLIGLDDTIRLPPQSQQVEHEAELAVVVGKRGRWIDLENVPDHIFGYTLANDVTARDLQRRDAQWTRGKGFDTFCALGPWVETEFDHSDVIITCHVNGELRQMASTRDMIFSVRQLVVYVSSVMTLEPGDVLLTGTPAGVGPLLPDDVVEIAMEGLGTLRNRVAEEQPR
jgi:2-keto-4-pentenoate hydratase/2-oxohepta-3-ene-1,7-dioic acid hydratase in catechol pathway